VVLAALRRSPRVELRRIRFLVFPASSTSTFERLLEGVSYTSSSTKENSQPRMSCAEEDHDRNTFRPNLPSNGLATFSSDRNMEKAVDQWRRGGTGTSRLSTWSKSIPAKKGWERTSDVCLLPILLAGSRCIRALMRSAHRELQRDGACSGAVTMFRNKVSLSLL